MEDYERVLLVKQEVFVFKIPARTSIKNYRQAAKCFFFGNDCYKKEGG